MDTNLPPTDCLPVSASTLGFSVYVPGPPASEDALQSIEDSIKYKNLVGLELLTETISKQALDPATTLRGKLDAAEMMRKLAGLDAKKLDASQLGGGVSITINMPSKTRPPVVFQGDAAEVVDVDTEAEPRD